MIKLITKIKSFITAQKNKLRISPITQKYCDKKLVEAVNRTALYGMAKPARFIVKTASTDGTADPLRAVDSYSGYADFDGIKITPQHIGGEATYMSTPPAFGRVFPWPCPFVRYFAECHGKDLERNLDSAIVQQLADKSLAKDRVTFKKCMTEDVLKKAANRVIELSDHSGYFLDSDSAYLICVTSVDRIRKSEIFKIDGGNFETSEEYQDYIDRKLYVGEYGRLKMHDGFYIVFLTTLDDRMMHSLLIGPDALTMIPLENNLKAIFRRTPAGEAGRQPRGYDVGYYMELGVEADLSRCVILEATKRLEKV